MSDRVKKIVKNALEGVIEDNVSEIVTNISERRSVLQVQINHENSVNVISESVSTDLFEPGINKTNICADDSSCFETCPIEVDCFDANPALSTSILNVTDDQLNQIRYDFDSDDSIVDPDFYGDDLGLSTDESDDQVKETPRKKKCTGKNNSIKDSNLNHAPDNDLTSTEEDSNKANKKDQDDISIENEPNNTETITEKKKKQGRTRKQRQESKELRNAGKSYATEKGKVVQARNMNPLKACRMKCKERFSDEDRHRCFQEYWNLGSRDKRANYIASLMNLNEKKMQKLGPRKKHRECSYKYSIVIAGVQKPICKCCFIATFGETKGFVEIVGEKKKNAFSGIIPPDSRGIAPSGNRRSLEEIQNAKDHILSFPKYESHYCRNRTSKKYLSSDLSIAKMYDMYKEIVDKPVSLTLYKNCFYSLNLAFKKPKQDTCSKCDIFETKLKVVEGEEKENLIQERDKHHQLADDAYKAKQMDKEIAASDTKKRAYTFDLQQCLPTPFLTANTVFYKRQLWTFDLTVHDLTSNEVTCFMWDESTAGRGGNQIASCIYRLLLELRGVEEVTFYSDTCGGQNKNQQVAFMFSFILSKCPNIKIINHKFLVSGHTHMECDTDHALIEKEKKRTHMKINHPNDWYQMVRSCRRKKPFKVEVMKQEDFLDISTLGKGPLVVKKVNTDGEKFLWQPVQWLQYNSEFGIVKYKHSLDVSSPFKSINFRRRGKHIIPTSLPQITDKPLPISKEKKQDLLDLLPLIDEVFHNFYRNLPTTDMKDLDPDLEEFDPDDQ